MKAYYLLFLLLLNISIGISIGDSANISDKNVEFNQSSIENNIKELNTTREINSSLYINEIYYSFKADFNSRDKLKIAIPKNKSQNDSYQNFNAYRGDYLISTPFSQNETHLIVDANIPGNYYIANVSSNKKLENTLYLDNNGSCQSMLSPDESHVSVNSCDPNIIDSLNRHISVIIQNPSFSNIIILSIILILIGILIYNLIVNLRKKILINNILKSTDLMLNAENFDIENLKLLAETNQKALNGNYKQARKRLKRLNNNL